MAEWLGRGLQNLLRRFESARRLKNPRNYFSGVLLFSKLTKVLTGFKKTKMFGLFKSKKEKLQQRYEKLLKEAYTLSSTNRKESDRKTYEADLLAKEIERLR